MSFEQVKALAIVVDIGLLLIMVSCIALFSVESTNTNAGTRGKGETIAAKEEAETLILENLVVKKWTDYDFLLPPITDLKEINIGADNIGITSASINPKTNTLFFKSTINQGIDQGNQKLSYFYDTYTEIKIDLNTMRAEIDTDISKIDNNRIECFDCRVVLTKNNEWNTYDIYAEASEYYADNFTNDGRKLVSITVSSTYSK